MKLSPWWADQLWRVPFLRPWVWRTMRQQAIDALEDLIKSLEPVSSAHDD